MEEEDLRAASAVSTPLRASLLVGMDLSTLSSWLRPRGRRLALVHTSPGGRRGWPTIPLVGIAEAHVIKTLRRLQIPMSKISDLVVYLRGEAADPYALASPRIVTDGIDLYIKNDGELERAFDGQKPIKEIVADYLQELIVWPDGYAGAYTPPRLSYEGVQVDPKFSAGRLSFVRNRVPLFAVAGALSAGDDPHAVAVDFGLTEQEVALVERHLNWIVEAA